MGTEAHCCFTDTAALAVSGGRSTPGSLQEQPGVPMRTILTFVILFGTAAIASAQSRPGATTRPPKTGINFTEVPRVGIRNQFTFQLAADLAVENVTIEALGGGQFQIQGRVR